MSFSNVNFLSILAATVAGWLVGGLYYTVLSKRWIAARGTTLDRLKAEQAGRSGLAKSVPFILAFVGEFIMAWTLYGILFHLNMFNVRAGAIAGVFCWFGFVLTTQTINNAFCDRKGALTVIDSAAWLICMVVMGAIIGAWGH
jgi:hypothetical protein